jgi:hypothetical protein
MVESHPILSDTVDEREFIHCVDHVRRLHPADFRDALHGLADAVPTDGESRFASPAIALYARRSSPTIPKSRHARFSTDKLIAALHLRNFVGQK